MKINQLQNFIENISEINENSLNSNKHLSSFPKDSNEKPKK